MMSLWKWASGVLKDQNSILLARYRVGRRSVFRNPAIEAVVIKATRHDEYPIDQRYVDRIYEWISLSPNHLKPIVWAITMRVENSRSWEVALKALMLTHRLMRFNTNIIGRLPFDLSAFTDRHSHPHNAWPLNAFVRSYFAFLDHKSIILFHNPPQEPPAAADTYHRKITTSTSSSSLSSFSVSQDLNTLRNLQGLLDILLQVRPHPEVAASPLVAEAMDIILLEVHDIYHRICIGIARVLLRIYMVGKADAKVALQIVHKATLQGEALTLYYDFCTEHGFITNLDCPKVKQIPEEDIRELEDIIKGPSPSTPTKEHIMTPKTELKTVITQHWETFDDDQMLLATTCAANNVHAISHQDLPDLITFSNLLSV